MNGDRYEVDRPVEAIFDLFYLYYKLYLYKFVFTITSLTRHENTFTLHFSIPNLIH